MPELRRDPITGRWVIISTDRRGAPATSPATTSSRTASALPVLPGQRDKTPPEVLAYRDGGAANEPGWSLRVVPNKFPALRVEGDGAAGRGHLRQDERHRRARGHHRNARPHADHRPICRKSASRTCSGPTATASWISQGPAPALHPSVQEPRRSRRRLARAHPHPAHRPAGGPQARAGGDRRRRDTTSSRSAASTATSSSRNSTPAIAVVLETDHFVAFAPYAPRFPFETWILPRAHRSHFEESDAPSSRTWPGCCGPCLRKIDKVLEQPPYNWMIHSAPGAGGARCRTTTGTSRSFRS